MRRMMNLILLGVLGLTSFGAVAHDSKFELTPMLGYRFSGDLVAESSDFLEADVEIDSSESLSLLAVIPLVHSLNLELLISQQSTDLKIDQGLFSEEVVLGGVDVDYYIAGLQWQFEHGDTTPYVSAGLGMVKLSLDTPGASDEEVFTGSFGGGIVFELTPRIGLRLDARGFWSNTDRDSFGFDDCDGDCYRAGYDDDLFQSLASVGVSFSF